MRIVHVEEFFHPDAGYQVNILAKYMARKGHKVFVVCGEIDKFPEYLTSFFGKENIESRDAAYTEEYGVTIIRIPVDLYFYHRSFFNKKLYNVLKGLKPDVVFAHGHDTVTGTNVIRYCVHNAIPVVSDTHNCDIASTSKIRWIFQQYYKYFQVPILLKNEVPIVKTANIDFVQKKYGIPEHLTPWISFGSDLMLFHPDREVRRDMRKKYGIQESDFLFVYAGKLDESKGGLFLAESVKNNLTTKKKVAFVVIGSSVGTYGDKVENTFGRSENRIIRLPTQKYRDLAKYFQMADAALLPRQTSLTFYDYQACGLPVISEDVEINDERTKFGNGFIFKSESVESFREKMLLLVNMDKENFFRMSQAALEYVVKNFDYGKKCDEYLDIISETVSREKVL